MEEKMSPNWPVIGHHNVVQYLQNALRRHQFAHTYLFSGPAHVGKSLVAEYFIQTLFCLNYQESGSAIAWPCGECQSCRQFGKGVHPDYFLLSPEEGKRAIGIDQVREWQRSLGNKSFLTKYKIGLIAGAELLTTEAANALLKTIEEPVGNTIIVLLTDDLNLLLPTIISRSQVIKFGPVAEKDILQYLVQLGEERSDAALAAQLARGLPGQALEYKSDPDSLKNYLASIDQVIDLLLKPTHERLDYLQSLSHDREATDSLIQDLLNKLLLVLREALLASVGANQGYNLSLNREQLDVLTKKYRPRQLAQMLMKIFEWQAVRAYNPNSILFAENLLLTV